MDGISSTVKNTVFKQIEAVTTLRKRGKDSFAIMKTWCASCIKRCDRGIEAEDWLKYSICLQWIYMTCFKL